MANIDEDIKRVTDEIIEDEVMPEKEPEPTYE